MTNAKSAADTNPKVAAYTYTPKAERETETKANGNTVTYDYFLDSLLRHSLERKSNGTVVAEHTIGYQGNLNRASDQAKLRNADNPGAYLENTYAYTYDPGTGSPRRSKPPSVAVAAPPKPKPTSTTPTATSTTRPSRTSAPSSPSTATG
ncbi:hypothetical protein GCM10009555_036560 [Acrocarpospora macrocephala]|uniref:Uncharacterized protein n=1 Tax=Acrocarpospora macrocephala TaxID=150177 RepID=A0A5M3WUT8_9ACTN|nr:hypothetical protein [Acrocarpospora macrocephala]GES13217.1 hypothetical protein Amac_068140 [Acrocarpospora macrocephala]